jgi:hypothetical protein
VFSFSLSQAYCSELFASYLKRPPHQRHRFITRSYDSIKPFISRSYAVQSQPLWMPEPRILVSETVQLSGGSSPWIESVENGCWGEYLDQRQEVSAAEENCTLNSFIICTPQQILLGWSNQGWCEKWTRSSGANKNMVMGPNGARNQQRLCWRGPAEIYCYAMLQTYRQQGDLISLLLLFSRKGSRLIMGTGI